MWCMARPHSLGAASFPGCTWRLLLVAMRALGCVLYPQNLVGAQMCLGVPQPSLRLSSSARIMELHVRAPRLLRARGPNEFDRKDCIPKLQVGVEFSSLNLC